MREITKSQNVTVETSGAKYKVDLKPEQDDYLLWDKPLSEQSEKVKKALQQDKVTKRNGAKYEDLIAAVENFEDSRSNSNLNLDGSQLYRMAQDTHGSQKAASEYLKPLGIRGIKYLDGTSRSKGEGAYNYVIFDDADIEITEILASSKIT